MLKELDDRKDLALIAFLIYLIPILMILFFLSFYISLQVLWPFYTIGILLAAIGSIFIFALIQNSTRSIEKNDIVDEVSEPEEIQEVNNSFYEAMENEITTLNELLSENKLALEEQLVLYANQSEDLKYFKEKLKKQEDDYFLLQEEFKKYQLLSENQIEEEKKLHMDALETISELRANTHHKQQQIEILENKIHDLSFEIKTILQITDLTSIISSKEIEPGNMTHDTAHAYQVPLDDNEEMDDFTLSHVTSSDDAKKQLKRCIDIAQKITGAQHLSSNKSRFGDFSFDNYALNLRRLYDSLRSENSCTIFVFSPKENKLIFINNQVKELLGWNPEKFVLDFEDIVQDGILEWKHSLSQLSIVNYNQSRLVMKAKSGKDLLLHCQIGLIPTGVFKGNVIGVLYPA